MSKNYRSAVKGKYIKKAEAEANPRETVSEQRKSKAKRK